MSNHSSRHHCVVKAFTEQSRAVLCLFQDVWYLSLKQSNNKVTQRVGTGLYMIWDSSNLFSHRWAGCVSCQLRVPRTIISTNSSVQFSHSDSLWPHGLQHARPPCPSPTAGVYPNSCPLSQWCHPAISSSVIPFTSCLQPFPASGSFQMSQLFASGGQNIGVSASTSVLPMKSGMIFFTMDWLDLLAVQGTLKSLLQHHSSKASIVQRSAFLIVQLSHPYMLLLLLSRFSCVRLCVTPQTAAH